MGRGQDLRPRVIRAAEEALAHHSYVSAIDILSGIGWLGPSVLESWRHGRIACMEECISVSPAKISEAMNQFHIWARDKGLKPSETRYVRRGRNGIEDLRFTQSGNPDIEQSYRTHFVSPSLSEQKQQQMQDKLDQDPRSTVFQVARDSKCSECGIEILQDSLLMMDGNEPLCMACAHMDNLEFLPSGDAALTRRAGKFSSRVATVVRWSKSRKRYERQGILVEPAALEKAEESCKQDASERAANRMREAVRRREEDRRLAVRMAERIAMLFPGCPAAEAEAVARHTAQRGSGRVGRTEEGRNLDERALTLAVIAAIRHQHTNYDELLANEVDRETARELVLDQVNEILNRWRS